MWTDIQISSTNWHTSFTLLVLVSPVSPGVFAIWPVSKHPGFIGTRCLTVGCPLRENPDNDAKKMQDAPELHQKRQEIPWNVNGNEGNWRLQTLQTTKDAEILIFEMNPNAKKHGIIIRYYKRYRSSKMKHKSTKNSFSFWYVLIQHFNLIHLKVSHSKRHHWSPGTSLWRGFTTGSSEAFRWHQGFLVAWPRYTMGMAVTGNTNTATIDQWIQYDSMDESCPIWSNFWYFCMLHWYTTFFYTSTFWKYRLYPLWTALMLLVVNLSQLTNPKFFARYIKILHSLKSMQKS